LELVAYLSIVGCDAAEAPISELMALDMLCHKQSKWQLIEKWLVLCCLIPGTLIVHNK